MGYRREDYGLTGPVPWLDRPDAVQAVERRLAAGEIDAAQAGLCRSWIAQGYLRFEGLVEAAACEAVNADIERVIEENRHLPIDVLKKKFQDVYQHSQAVRELFCHPEVLARLDLLLGTRALPYQTLNLPVSSQQAAHSDEILMTTNPPGYLAAAWIALEDIAPDSGPLIVYPGSHRIPYVGARETGIPRGSSEEDCGRVFDANYYGIVAERVRESGIEPIEYTPRQGDVLFWHSGLIHGARPIRRAGATRRSMISHYFGAGALPYSDLFERPCPLPGLRPAE